MYYAQNAVNSEKNCTLLFSILYCSVLYKHSLYRNIKKGKRKEERIYNNMYILVYRHHYFFSQVWVYRITFRTTRISLIYFISYKCKITVYTNIYSGIYILHNLLWRSDNFLCISYVVKIWKKLHIHAFLSSLIPSTRGSPCLLAPLFPLLLLTGDRLLWRCLQRSHGNDSCDQSADRRAPGNSRRCFLWESNLFRLLFVYY